MMRRRRKLAIRILDTVVRRSLPSYRDWAEASRRELEFIEGDWAALGWALGSWKMAARCQCAPPLTSMAEVPGRARSFLRETRVSTGVTWCSLLWMSYWFTGIFRPTATAGQNRLGWALLAAMATYIACNGIVFRGWRSSLTGGLEEAVGAYRAALVQQRELQSGVWYWLRGALMVAGPLLGAYRSWLLKPGAARESLLSANVLAGGVIVLAMLVAWPLTRRAVARYQRSIEELDALAGEKG